MEMKRWLVLLLWPFYSVAQTADNSIASLHSTRWQGSATIAYSGGEREGARCIATYFVTNASVKQNLRCATASAKITVKTEMAVRGQQLSGTWSEESYGIEGQVAGRIVANGFDLRISSTLLTGTLKVANNNCAQDVTLSAPDSMLAGMTIRMNKDNCR